MIAAALYFLTICGIVLAQDEATLKGFSTTQVNTSLWLSAAAYCGSSSYKSHVFKGPTTGFVVTAIIEDLSTDTEGFIGYLPSDKSIYVVFRGSSSIRNWITNLDAYKTPYTSYPACNCEVHKGFYNAEQIVIKGIISEVKRLKSMSSLSSYAVKTTGHSLGAALAQLTAMDLLNAGYAVSMYNFGQPRVGDKAYAVFSSSTLSTFRVTHDKDIVPHIPLSSGMDFYHACFEEFEDVNHNLRTCSSTKSQGGAYCEDSSCADQYKVEETNVDDHLVYLRMSVSCDAVST
eukprot:gene35367-45810_t